MKPVRFFVSCVLVAALAAFLFMVPVSRNVSASFVLRPIDADRVFVVEAGKIKTLNKQAGDPVSKGDVIAVLENDDLYLQAQQLNGELAREKATLASLKLASRDRAGIGRQIAETSARIFKIERRMEIQSQKQKQLELVASRDGQVIAPPNVVARPAESGSHLQRWSGNPMDAKNRGAHFEASTLFCIVGDPDKMQAMLVVDESDIKLVSTGQKVQLLFDELPSRRFDGEVVSVSRDSLTELPRELSITNGGKVAVGPGVDGTEAPLLTTYEVLVSINNDDDQKLLTGFRGSAKIEVSNLPLGQQLVRYARTVINFR